MATWRQWCAPALTRAGWPGKSGCSIREQLCHVMNRGDWREEISQGDNHPRLFLDTLWQAYEKTDGLGRKAAACENTRSFCSIFSVNSH